MKDSIYALAPVNSTAARVVGHGTHYQPNIKPCEYESKLPMPTVECPSPDHDLTGKKFGRFVVVGVFAEKVSRWVVRCSCGTYAVRSARAIKNPDNKKDGCRECRHLDHLKRSNFWARTGRNIEDFGLKNGGGR